MFRKYSALLGLTVVVLMLVIAPFALVQPARAQFVIAASPQYDDYGQAILGIEVYENSTGSWVVIDHPFDIAYLGKTFEWTAGVGIKIHAVTYFNSTLTGAGDTDEGKLYQQHNVTVTNRAGVEIFSQANFTYVSVITSQDPIWYYEYSVVLNFFPAHLVSYLVTVTYEVFYAEV